MLAMALLNENITGLLFFFCYTRSVLLCASVFNIGSMLLKGEDCRYSLTLLLHTVRHRVYSV